MEWHALHGKIVLCNAMTLDCYCLYIERAVSWKATEILYCGDRCVHARHARITKVLIREPVLLEPPHLPRTHRASKSCLLQHGGAPKVVMCHCNLWTCVTCMVCFHHCAKWCKWDQHLKIHMGVLARVHHCNRFQTSQMMACVNK